jgi:hypothetical protein
MRKEGPRSWFWFKAAAVLASAGALAVIAFCAAALWDLRRAARRPVLTDGPVYALNAGVYETVNPDLPYQTFSELKRPGELRVFLLGSSQAMGSPYVHQHMNILSSRLLGLPNEGGLATWLRRYLQAVFPGRPVTVINAARGGGDLEAAVAVLREVLAAGRPDAVVLLEGNNERAAPSMDKERLRPEAGLDKTVAFLTRRFSSRLAEASRLAREAGVPLYVLTVPTNLRHWLPHDRENSRRPTATWERAVFLDESGAYAAALRAYKEARDGDYAFLRARAPWNEAIRRLPAPARVIDLERLMEGHAKDGIPGGDLFHDYCHFTLPANRLAGLETSKRLAADFGAARAPVLADARWDDFRRGRLRALYAIKALKWRRARGFAGLSAAQAKNAATVAETYLHAVEGL